MSVASNISRSLNPQNRQFGQVSNPPTSPALNVAVSWDLSFKFPLTWQRLTSKPLTDFSALIFLTSLNVSFSLQLPPQLLSSIGPLLRFPRHACLKGLQWESLWCDTFPSRILGWTVGSGGQGHPQISILPLLKSFPGPVFMDHRSGFKSGLIIELDTGESVFQPDFQSSGFRFCQICLGSKQVNKQ